MYRKIFKEELNESESKKLSNVPNYLILIEDKGRLEEIIPACTITKVLEIARNKKQILTVFEKQGTASCYWRFLFNCSCEVM